MAIAAAMSGDDGKDEHEHDIVMPGFRFHPTEEELIEFYLRRKVEGKRFNIELISFLDLYHYDPWELPPLAAIGEKEWFFYVPRDRKYRNGDRPNRVTRSGYWKATGADRTIRGENSRSIGLKKTLVFYSGKAPKGIRTSWIMNEYRLPQCEATRHPKAEISLCRVYKRSEVEDRFRLSSRPVSSRGAGCDKTNMGCPPSTSFKGLAGDSSSSETEKMHKPIVYDAAAMIAPLSSNSLIQDGVQLQLLSSTTDDELNRLLSYNQSYLNQLQNQYLPLTSQPQLVAFEGLHNSLPEKLWDWNKQLRG